MIQIFKPSTIPKKLEEEGKKLTEKNCLDYEAHHKSYQTDKIDFFINSVIYNHSTVKTSLKKAQNNKCCFCEKEQMDEYGAVEHYRPKNGFRSGKKEKLKKPGYYWLGYEWDNLYFVCSACNTNKANFFPLKDEKKRATNHKMNIEEEIPLLIDPGGKENPRNHIVFDYHLPRGISDFGKTTIDICKLDRDSLNEKRKKLIDDLMICIKVIKYKNEYDNEVVELAVSFIKKSKERQAEFSAAAIDYLKQFDINLD